MRMAPAPRQAFVTLLGLLSASVVRGMTTCSAIEESYVAASCCGEDADFVETGYDGPTRVSPGTSVSVGMEANLSVVDRRVAVSFSRPAWPLGTTQRLLAESLAPGEPIWVVCECQEPTADTFLCAPYVDLDPQRPRYGCMQSECTSCRRELLAGIVPVFDAFLRRTDGAPLTTPVFGDAIRAHDADEPIAAWNALSPYNGTQDPALDAHIDAMDPEWAHASDWRAMLTIVGHGRERVLLAVPFDRIPIGAFYASTPITASTDVKCYGSCVIDGEGHSCRKAKKSKYFFYCEGCHDGCAMEISTN